MPRPDLAADCGRCAALCCVWTAFDASDDFAFDKPAGVPCPHLRGTRCAVHAELVPRGLGGCAAYDCHGAGPRATRLLASALLSPRQRHDVFAILREIHELLWVLTGAEALYPGLPGAAEAIDALDRLARSPARALLAAELGPHRAAARAVRRGAAARLGPPRAESTAFDLTIVESGDIERSP